MAFGLRIRTPILKQVILKSKSTPILASAEGRTIGNAIGQSYGLLNSRAFSEFMKIVRKSKYKYDIRPMAQIHDAGYFAIKANTDVIKFVNDTYIKCMEWQEDPNISDPDIKLGGELDIYYPSWAEPCTLDNYISKQEIVNKFKEHIQ